MHPHECKLQCSCVLYLHLHSTKSPLIEDHRTVLLQDTILHQVSEVVVARVCYVQGETEDGSSAFMSSNFSLLSALNKEEACTMK